MLEYLVIATIIIAAVFVGSSYYEKSLHEEDKGDAHQIQIEPIHFEEPISTYDKSDLIILRPS